MPSCSARSSRRGEQLAIANEHKSQFFANMSHELRTPLNAVLGYAELLVDGLYGEMPDKALGGAGSHPDQRQASARADQRRARHLEDRGRPAQAGARGLFAWKASSNTVVASTGSLAQAKGIEIKTNIPSGLPIGRGDERRLTQVLLNLVSNAIKFTDSGSVEIRVNAVDGQFNIAVQDTGPGIAPAGSGAASSRSSSRSTTAARGRKAAPDWGCRSRAGWSRCTAAGSIWSRRSVSARPSPSSFRCASNEQRQPA